MILEELIGTRCGLNCKAKQLNFKSIFENPIQSDFLNQPEARFIEILVYFWNVNGRWPLMDKKFMYDFDIIFISETHTSGQILMDINGFYKIADPDFKSSRHGGTGAYIKSSFRVREYRIS